MTLKSQCFGAFTLDKPTREDPQNSPSFRLRRDLELAFLKMESDPVRNQADWVIDSVNGSDDFGVAGNEAHPLASFEEWQRRVGRGTVLSPTGGLLTLLIKGAPGGAGERDVHPASDKITWRNTMANNCLAIIQSPDKVLASGTLTEVTAIVREDKVFGKVTAEGFDFGPYEGWGHIKTADGAFAWIDEDLGDGEAIVSRWTSRAEWFPGAVDLADTPENGTAFEVIGYTEITRGDQSVAYDPSTGTVFGPPGGLIHRRLHCKGPDGAGPAEGLQASFPTVHGCATVVASFVQCVLDHQTELPAGSVTDCADCCSRGTMILDSGSDLFVTAGLFKKVAPWDYPGGIKVKQGATLQIDGDPLFSGADIQCWGTIFTGPLCFRDSLHGLVVMTGGNVWWQSFSPYAGENGYVPIWGNVEQPLHAYPGGKYFFEQFVFAPDTPKLPTLEAQGDADATVAALDNSEDSDKAVAFIKATAATAPYTDMIDIKWANFDVAIPNGFKVSTVTDGPVVIRTAHAKNPGTGASIHWQSTVFTP